MWHRMPHFKGEVKLLRIEYNMKYMNFDIFSENIVEVGTNLDVELCRIIMFYE